MLGARPAHPLNNKSPPAPQIPNPIPPERPCGPAQPQHLRSAVCPTNTLPTSACSPLACHSGQAAWLQAPKLRPQVRLQVEHPELPWVRLGYAPAGQPAGLPMLRDRRTSVDV
eukprot:365636-Chlamydomonas_euryale.AAC.14